MNIQNSILTQGIGGMVIATFIFVIIVFIIIFGSIIARWKKNNNSPRLTVHAKVVSKRMRVSRNQNGYSGGMTHYYVTFQVSSKDRMELYVSGEEYGILAEGDEGELSFQGTRYLGFRRTN